MLCMIYGFFEVKIFAALTQAEIMGNTLIFFCVAGLRWLAPSSEAAIEQGGMSAVNYASGLLQTAMMVFGGLAVVYFVLAFGLWKRRIWARRIMILLCWGFIGYGAYSVVASGFGFGRVVLNVFVVWPWEAILLMYLNKPNVKAAFQG